MRIEQWNELSQDVREKLISAVFNNPYLMTHAERDPKTDPIIKEVLRVTLINGDTAYITINKKMKIR